MKELELYLHIPFCVKKCNYCDFLSAPAEEKTRAAYVDTLIREIEGFEEPEDYEVVTVFFGGGTPSILPGEAILRLMEALRKKFHFREEAEITLEANPGTVDEKKLSFYKKAGINRLSFGLQSTDAEELKKLGRIHTWEKFLESFELARKAGFSNINVDLMSALPGQTVESWEKTLKQVIALNPEHVSAYSLIIEEGTPFYQLYEKDAEKRDAGEEPELLPSEEEERAMYELTGSVLKENGYLHYEISNYAKPGRECRHNLGYWQRKDYLGFGLGASTLLNPVRYKNTEDLCDLSRRRFFQKGISGAHQGQSDRGDDVSGASGS